MVKYEYPQFHKYLQVTHIFVTNNQMIFSLEFFQFDYVKFILNTISSKCLYFYLFKKSSNLSFLKA